MEIMWNPNNSAMYGGFTMETSCKRVERSVTERDSVDVRCCGYYPKVIILVSSVFSRT
jgi:hypothetical protein